MNSKHGNTTKIIFYISSIIIYLSIIFYLSHLKPCQIPINTYNLWDKLLHFIQYTPLGFLLAGLYTAISPQISKLRLVLTMLILGIILGSLDEFHQSFIPQRDASAYDVIADTLGVLFGTTLFIIWNKIMTIRQKQQPEQ